MNAVFFVMAMLCDPQGAQCQRTETSFVNQTGSKTPCTDWLLEQLEQVVNDEEGDGIVLAFECRPEKKGG